MRSASILAASLFATLLLTAQINFYPPIDAPTVNGSVTITTGGTFQQVLAAVTPTTAIPNPRHSLTIQNNNTTTDNCWLSFGTIGGTPITAANATTATSILLTPGGSFQRYSPFVPVDAIIATCATSNDTLYIDTQ